MKFLLQQVFAHTKPYYLASNYLDALVKHSARWHKIVTSVGKPKQHLFLPGGFDGIEFDAFNVGILNSDSWEIYLERVRRLQEQGLKIESVHAVYPPAQFADPHQAAKTLNLGFLSGEVVNGIKTHIRLASALVDDNPTLVLHPGIIPAAMPMAEAIGNVVNNVKLCLTDLEKTKVILCLENLAPILDKTKIKVVASDYNVLKEIVADINHPQVKVVYDWGHANASARVYYEENSNKLPEDYLPSFQYHHDLVKTLGQDIVYLHLNYNPAHIMTTHKPRMLGTSGWDFHQGLNQADPQSLARYKEIMEEVYFNTGLRKTGRKMLLELNPRGLLKWLGMGYVGTDDVGALESVRILRSWFMEFEHIGKEKGHENRT